MSAGEYRRYAVECFRIAEGTTGFRNRLLLITMAQSWLLLAEQAEKNLAADLVYEAPPPHEAGRPAVAQQQQQIQPKKEE